MIDGMLYICLFVMYMSVVVPVMNIADGDVSCAIVANAIRER